MIEFDDKFFLGEEREGFYVEEKMKRAWAAQMEVLAELDRICKKEGIRYFAESGTLLGAVRHKGFIPWDDDIDIAMTRDAYHKLFQAAPRELPKGWILRDWSNGGGAPFGRLVNTERICFDEEHMRRFHGCPYIVGVDIFPLDCVPKDKDEDETWHLLLRFLSALSGKIKENGNREPTEEILSGLTSVNEWCGFVFDRQKDLNAQIRTLMLQLVQCYQSEEAAELELAVWDWAKERRLKYKREWYAESIEVPFENITIPIPYGYDEVLRVLYGDNYMTPVQNAADHDYPFYKSQDRELERRKGKG